MKPLIRLRQISKSYQMGGDGVRVEALKKIDLDIFPGEFVAIMGPSGSGKSTLLQILGLLDRPTSGDFEYFGREVSSLSEDEMTSIRSRLIGFVFQFFNLLPRTSALDNVKLPLLYAGADNQLQRCEELLKRLGLEERIGHRPHQLSGGQQQRVAIARALANQPYVILADEPTGNISSVQAEEILDLLKELNRSGITVILVTHEPEVARKARRLITIRDGVVAEDLRLAAEPPAIERAIDINSLSENRKQGSGWLREGFRMALIALRLNLLRTCLATLGIVIGIASFTAMMAIGDGAKQQFAMQMSRLGTNLLNIRPLSVKLAKVQAFNYRRLSLEDYLAVREFAQQRPEIAKIDAQILLNVVVERAGKNSVSELVGASPLIHEMQDMRLVAGRYFTEAESLGRERVVILGPTVVRNLFPANTNPIGSVVKINRTDYEVIGVLASKGGTAWKDRDDLLLAPLETVLYRLQGARHVDVITLEVRDASLMGAVTDMLYTFMRAQRRISAEEKDNFEILNMSDVRRIFNESVQIITSMLQAIAMICLLVGGIGIMNVMFVSVKERTREVGLRKALGARPINILAQFVIEAVLIGMIGGVIGIAVGFSLALGFSYFLGWQTLMSTSAVMLSLSFSILVGILFGLWPARQAARLSPIEALRYE